MTAKTYALNAEAAREADGGRLDRTGAYVGKFTLAMNLIAQSGATGITFNFEADSGEQAQYLNLYTANAVGQPIFGEKQLYALMTCLKQRSISATPQEHELYDHDLRAATKQTVDVYSTLMNVPVGIVVQKEHYLNNLKEPKERLNLIRFFDPATRQTASEILDKSPAKKLDAQLGSLKDKIAPGARPAKGASTEHDPNADFDDDLPF